jgi:hypothetical protein
MPTQVQFRRGTTAQNNNFTGAAGELSVNTSNSSIRVHDGSTQGGFELANMNRSLRQFASTTSDELRSVLSDETGTGNAVFSLSPTILSPTVETSIVAGNTTFNLVNTVATTVNFAGAATTLSIGAGSGTTTVNNNLTVAANTLANNGVVTNALTAGTLQTTGNVNAAAGRIAGNFTTTGVLRVTDTTAATGTGTGAAIFSGGASVSGNLYVGGNLFIAGTATTLNSNVLVIEDSLIFLADNSTANLLDLGMVGTFNNGVQQHTGFVRDATDGTWKLFSNVISEPNATSIVDFTSAVYDPVRVGAITATTGSFSSTITGSANVDASSVNITNAVTAGTLQTSGNVNGNNGRFTTALTAATLQSTGNLNAAAALISGNFNATGNVNAVDGRFSTALTAATLQSTGNVNTAAGLVTGNHTAANYQTTGNLNAAAALISGNFNATGAVNASSMRVASSGVAFLGSSSGTITVQPTSVAGTTTITLPATSGTVVTTGDSGTVTSTMIADGTIVNGDISASAAIAVSKLAASTISGITLGNNLNTLTLATSGTGLSGSTTYNGSGAATFTVTSNATSANTGSAIVARDSSGNFSAGTITATLSGTATTSTNSTITDDTSTNATHYPNFVAGTSGAQGEKVSSTKFTFNPSTGLLTSTDYNSSSDKRLKSNIKTVEGALDKVNSLRGVTFKWKEGGSDSIGLIAQEVQKVIPEVVTKDDNGYLGIRYTNLIGVLVEAIKEQQDQINTLKKQIEKLNG